jgi:hypothetical protein
VLPRLRQETTSTPEDPAAVPGTVWHDPRDYV